MSRLYNIETFPIDRVKDELLPVQIEGFEELTHLARAVLDSCPVVCDSIDESNQPTLNFEDLTEITRPDGDSYYLTQASSKHLRSFLVKGGGFEKTWHDEHNNLYSSITLKGNNYTHSMLMESATATDRYIAYGMQESAIIERVLRASRMLREAGISTEYIVGLAEPKEFLIRDNGMAVSQLPVGIDAYKQFLTEKHWRDLGDEDRNFEAYLDISKKMERSTYYISMRAMDSDYRYYDAANFPYARGKVYEQIKEYFGVELDTYNQEDWNKYVDEFFILCATSNLAKLHKLGVAHKYPNALNLTALGGIVDLDSAYGEPLDLGDEPITIEDIANDILMLGQTHDSTVFGMFNGFVSNFRQNVISSYYSNIDKIYDEEDAKQFKLKLGTALYEITEQYEVKKHVAEMLETEVIQEDLMNGITNCQPPQILDTLRILIKAGSVSCWTHL